MEHETAQPLSETDKKVIEFMVELHEEHHAKTSGTAEIATNLEHLFTHFLSQIKVRGFTISTILSVIIVCNSNILIHLFYL